MRTIGKVLATVVAVCAIMFVGLVVYTLVSLLAQNMPIIQMIGRISAVLVSVYAVKLSWTFIWKRGTV